MNDGDETEINELRRKVKEAMACGIVFDGGTTRNATAWLALTERAEALHALRWVLFGVPPEMPIRSPAVRTQLEMAGKLPSADVEIRSPVRD